MDKVGYLVEWTISEGKLDEFKAKAEGFIESVQQNEPGTLTYQWWLSEDGKKCLLHEVFADSAALLTHLANVGPSLPDLMALAPATRLEVFGAPSADARKALDELGAIYHPNLGGFER